MREKQRQRQKETQETSVLIDLCEFPFPPLSSKMPLAHHLSVLLRTIPSIFTIFVFLGFAYTFILSFKSQLKGHSLGKLLLLPKADLGTPFLEISVFILTPVRQPHCVLITWAPCLSAPLPYKPLRTRAEPSSLQSHPTGLGPGRGTDQDMPLEGIKDHWKPPGHLGRIWHLTQYEMTMEGEDVAIRFPISPRQCLQDVKTRGKVTTASHHLVVLCRSWKTTIGLFTPLTDLEPKPGFPKGKNGQIWSH